MCHSMNFIDSKSALIWLMARPWIGNKPSPNPERMISGMSVGQGVTLHEFLQTI